MIRQVIDIDGKWTVIVYYILNYNRFKYVADDLQRMGCEKTEVQSLYNNMVYGMVMGFTYSSPRDKVSIVGIGRHNDKAEYISTIVHEAEHVKNAIFDYYSLDSIGEPPAYTIGYIVKRMYGVFKAFLCR